MTPVHQVRRNEAFKGLPITECSKLTNYMHFRNVQDPSFKEKLSTPGAPFNFSFLEPLVVD